MFNESMITANPDVASQRLGDELILLHLRDGVYYGLDAVGARMWELITELGAFEQICAAILQEYDVPSEQAETDLASLIAELQNLRLVDVSNRDGAACGEH